MMILRKFQPDDLDSVMKLFHEVVHSVGAKYYNQTQVNAWAPHEGNDHKTWLKTLTNNYSYVVEEDGILIAFGDMTPNGYIDRLYVHKNHQGRGSALRIFRKLEEDARAQGLTELTCEASVMLKPLAEKYGFEVIEKNQKVHREVEFITYKMRKKLL